MSSEQHVAVIKAALSDFLYFQVKTGTDQAEFRLDIETEGYKVNWGGDEFLVERWGGDEGWVDAWRIPAAFLEPTIPDVPEGQSGDQKPTEGTGGARTGPIVTYTVANQANQEGGTWASVSQLVTELHPLRSDLKVLAIEPDGTRRGINPDEAIEMGMIVQQLGGVPA